MSAPGRPKREYRSAQREGFSIRAPGRPKREYRSAQREGFSIRAPGRPKREYRSAQREGTQMNKYAVSYRAATAHIATCSGP